MQALCAPRQGFQREYKNAGDRRSVLPLILVVCDVWFVQVVVSPFAGAAAAVGDVSSSIPR